MDNLNNRQQILIIITIIIIYSNKTCIHIIIFCFRKISKKKNKLLNSTICVCSRSKKDKSKGVAKSESSDPEPEGLTLLVPDIQRTAEIVYAATTNLRQANQGMYTQPNMRLYYLKNNCVCRVLILCTVCSKSEGSQVTLFSTFKWTHHIPRFV